MTPATICRFEAILETKISFFSRAISFLAAVSVNAIQRNNIDGTEPYRGAARSDRSGPVRASS